MPEAAPQPKFTDELSATLRALPDKGLFLALLAVWCALFHWLGNSALGYINTNSLFGWLYTIWMGSGDDQHGILIPIVVLVLLWWRRAELLALPKRNWWPPLLLVLLGLALHWLGFALGQARLSVVGFFLGLYGLTGLVWGGAWMRAIFFPFFLFVFCLPLAPFMEPISQPLRVLVATIVVTVSKLLGADVVQAGTQIFDNARTFAYDVAPACSGIRSVTMMFALTTIVGFISFRAWWRRGVMILAAIPVAVAGNVIRLTLVVFISELFGQDAGQWTETKLGFLTFLIALGAVILLARALREKEGQASEAKP